MEVYMIRRWLRGRWMYYIGMKDWSVNIEDAAELAQEDAYSICNIVGGEVVPYGQKD